VVTAAIAGSSSRHAVEEARRTNAVGGVGIEHDAVENRGGVFEDGLTDQGLDHRRAALREFTRERHDHAHLLCGHRRGCGGDATDADRLALANEPAASAAGGAARDVHRSLTVEAEADAPLTERRIDRIAGQGLEEVGPGLLDDFRGPTGHPGRTNGLVGLGDDRRGFVARVTLVEHLVDRLAAEVRAAAGDDAANHKIDALDVLLRETERATRDGRRPDLGARSSGAKADLRFRRLEVRECALGDLDLLVQLLDRVVVEIVDARQFRQPVALGVEVGLCVFDALRERLHVLHLGLRRKIGMGLLRVSGRLVGEVAGGHVPSPCFGALAEG
jgi:hypothetical protein